jgi:hypothetical protein
MSCPGCRAREWVEAVTLGEAASLDPLDPYFSVALTVYWSGSLPEAEERWKIFSAASAFESSTFQDKDRFLMEGLPVHVDYRSTAWVERLLGGGNEILQALRETGTLPLYRIETATVLHARGDWIERTRASLKSLPDPLWASLREAFLTRMEHFLVDLGASVLKKDDYFHQIARAGFIRYVASAIFASNHAFEPPHRYVSERIMGLPLLPDDFPGRWETLLRHEGEITPSRRYEVAKLVARSLFDMRGR